MASRKPARAGRPEPLFAGAMQDANAAVGRRQLVRHAPRAVGRIIVDDEDVRFRQDAANLRDQEAEVFPLVVGAERDQNRGSA